MNKPLKTPPSAFPVRFGKDDVFAEAGMTLRDWFAGQALIGVLAGQDSVQGASEADTIYTLYPPICYALADAVLAERSK